MANIAALLKKGCRDKPENDKPMSLTFLIGKVINRILNLDRIYQHVDKQEQIGDNQWRVGNHVSHA